MKEMGFWVYFGSKIALCGYGPLLRILDCKTVTVDVE